MEISSKEIVIILLGLIGSTLLVIWLESRNYFEEGFEPVDLIIILVIFTISLIFFIYRKFKEINKDLEKIEGKFNEQDKKLSDFLESLKRVEDLINIKVDIMDIKQRLVKSGN